MRQFIGYQARSRTERKKINCYRNEHGVDFAVFILDPEEQRSIRWLNTLSSDGVKEIQHCLTQLDASKANVLDALRYQTRRDKEVFITDLNLGAEPLHQRHHQYQLIAKEGAIHLKEKHGVD